MLLSHLFYCDKLKKRKKEKRTKAPFSEFYMAKGAQVHHVLERTHQQTAAKKER